MGGGGGLLLWKDSPKYQAETTYLSLSVTRRSVCTSAPLCPTLLFCVGSPGCWEFAGRIFWKHKLAGKRGCQLSHQEAYGPFCLFASLFLFIPLKQKKKGRHTGRISLFYSCDIISHGFRCFPAIADLCAGVPGPCVISKF